MRSFYFRRIALIFVVAAASLAAGEEISPAKGDELRSTYILGPDDQITIQALHISEIGDKPLRVDMSGFVRVPMAGRMRAGGLTVEQLEHELTNQLKAYVQEPEVTVTVAEFRSQPVSVMGAVKTPGVYQLQGRKTLIEILSVSGGLEQDAGDRVRITRRHEWGPLPVAGAHTDGSGQFYVAEVNLKELMQARNPADNFLVRPNDVITVPRADVVYVMGEVKKPGGFTLRDSETVSVLQALSLSEGLLSTAGAKKARILRPQPGNAQRQEIPVNVSSVLAGRTPDVPLKADDILFIPNSASKSALVRGLEAAVQTGTGVVVWHRF